MKILMALSRFPFPIDKGDKLRAYFQIKGLSENNELYLVCLSDQTPSEESIIEIKKYCKELVIIPQEKLSVIGNLVAGVFNSYPFQTNYFTSEKMKQVIEGMIKAHKIDLCYVQLVRLVNNIPFNLSTNYYLDYMDSMSKGMKNRYKLSKWYEKPFVKVEAERLVKFETQVFELFDGHSIISEADAKEFDFNRHSVIDVIPNGVNKEFLVQNLHGKPSKEFDIIFTGNMGYHPNVQACKYLVNQLLPELKKRGLNTKVCLVGIDPSAEVLELKSENVIITGYVKDIKNYLSRSKVFVAPLFSGAGLQNKLLEAMAVGVPVITTSLANNALGAKVNQEVLVCDELTTFADTIAAILNDDDKLNEIGESGKSFIEKNFNWENCNSLLEKSFERILKKVSIS